MHTYVIFVLLQDIPYAYYKYVFSLLCNYCIYSVIYNMLNIYYVIEPVGPPLTVSTLADAQLTANANE